MESLNNLSISLIEVLLKKFFSALSFVIVSIILISSVVLTSPTVSNALESSLSPEAKGDNPLRIVIEESEENQAIDQQETESYPYLGDDQVFPFVAGLGSYE